MFSAKLSEASEYSPRPTCQNIRPVRVIAARLIQKLTNHMLLKKPVTPQFENPLRICNVWWRMRTTTYLLVCTYCEKKKSRGEPKRKERIGNLRCNIFPPSCFSHSQLDTDSCPLSSAFNLTEVNPGKSAHTPLSLPN